MTARSEKFRSEKTHLPVCRVSSRKSGKEQQGGRSTLQKFRLAGRSMQDLIPMVIFFSVYLAWFFIIEHMNRLHYTVIHTALDDYIPFVEVFVIPYYLWFFYVTGAVIVLYFTDREMYHRTASLLCIGMTAFLLVSTLWPNIQYMRPSEFARDNLFTRMVGNIYRVDTPSNLCPSIHVYNSIGVAFGILGSRSKKLRSHAVRAGSVVLSAAISLSTMFIKQHSVFDVLCACAMAAGAYVLCFRWGFTFAGRYNMQGTLVRRRRRRQRQLIH